MHSKRAPISGDDYAPEHLIKPLTLWYPSHQDNCAPLSCSAAMTQPATLGKGQLLKTAKALLPAAVRNGKGSICLSDSKRECLKTESNYCSPERLMLPVLGTQTRTHKHTHTISQHKQSLFVPLCVQAHISLCVTRVTCLHSGESLANGKKKYL